MTLDAEGKIQNVKVSIEIYIHEKLVALEDLKVRFENTTFESRGAK